jgi:hypothetical protein
LHFDFKYKQNKHILEVFPASIGGKSGGGLLKKTGPYRHLALVR